MCHTASAVLSHPCVLSAYTDVSGQDCIRVSRNSRMGTWLVPVHRSCTPQGDTEPGTILQGGPIAQKGTESIQAPEAAPGGC